MGEKSGVSQQIISLPKGGGAIRGIGETFKPNLFTGTANFSVSIATSPGRGGFGPELTLQYSSGNGNGPFGLGWALSIPQVSRKTERGLPRYMEDDTFLLSGSEDLVERTDSHRSPRPVGNFRVTTYRPRVEGLFALIEKWELEPGNPTNPKLNNIFWKVTTKENITSIYGRTPQAVLANPDSPRKIYQWLLELTYDAKGNYIHYEYKKEDGVGVPEEIYEHNRRRYQIYLKRIRYGNLTPFNASASDAVDNPLCNHLADQDHFFMVVFDYGEHGAVDDIHEKVTQDMHKEAKPWDCRPDPFSTHRAGFEIRTYRRCKRVLMFHNRIPGENAPALVKSTDFLYKQNKDTLVSILVGVTQRGYKKATQAGDYQSEEIELGEPGASSTIYEIKSIPRLDFGYAEFKPQEQRYRPFQAKGGDMPPKGLRDPNFTLVSLFGTGLPDVLHTTPTGYYFWRNLGDGLFDRRQVLKNMPVGVTLDQDGVDFGDMAGDGQADLLVHTGRMWGFHEATNKGGWKKFHRYSSFPSFSLTDPNVRLVDLTGDGRSDALRTDQHHFSYFPCLGEEGFGEPKAVERIRDLNEFPDVYFDDPSRRVHLADMTGDGLKDIVLVHNGRVDYWPNLGYGRFGKRITMRNAPRFGHGFDPRRLFFVDIDGSGPADLVYVESGKIRFCFNQSGNGWSEENVISGTPMVTDVNSVQLADMFGNGSTGILWSTDYRGPQQSNYLFLDFTGGAKPYVLTQITNNMGATTRAKYRSSTHFYLEDLKKREHWITTIPFPVQVLEKVEVIDHISKSKLVTKFTYHHGYYDGREREFRGFGRVEQLDTEVFDNYNDVELGLHGEVMEFKQTDETTHVPPILMKHWFHTGVYEKEKKHLEILRSEYYQSDSEAFKASSKVEVGDAPFEAYRALKGANLRTEVYALDGRPEEEHPYTVTENGFQIKQVQPKNDRDHGVFVTTSLESFTFHYERNPADPRISHKITYEVDEYGNILKSLDIVYPRRNPIYQEQKKYYITYEDNKYVNQDDTTSPYFVGINYESKKIELKIANLPNIPVGSVDIAFFNIDDPKHNIFSCSRNYYDGPAYQGLPLGQIGSRGLLTRKETLILKKDQIADIYGNKAQRDDLTGSGYRESPAGSGNWWANNSRTKYGRDSKFFLPVGQKDPMGNETTIEYDNFNLLPRRTRAPLGTIIEAENDYHILSPRLTIDPNKNATQVEFDPVGMVIATALKGKVDQQGNIEGDPIDDPTTRIVYDFFNYWKASKTTYDDPKPCYMKAFKREEHYTVNPHAKEQESYAYFDGFGREIQTKIQAEPDPGNGNPRWVFSGWKIYNNKGWVVEQFEPFFSKTYEFEDDRKMGVSAKMTFDPFGRVIRTDIPDGSFSKVDFGPWHQTTMDSNDTVTDLKKANGTFVNEWYGQKSSGTPQEQDAAAKALAQKDTPTIVHLDTLGRNFLSIEDNGTFGTYKTLSEFDIRGNVTKIIDPRKNKAIEHKYDLAKNACYCWQMDSEERFLLFDAAGNLIKKWDSRDHLVEIKYDALNRSKEVWVTDLAQTSNKKRLAEKTVYGESENIPNPENRNLRGQTYQQYDGAGLVTYEKYDFKGNLLTSKRQILKNYKTLVDWSASHPPEFTDDLPFVSSVKFDALNRIKESITPDGCRYIPTFNKANLLDKVNVHISGEATTREFVRKINYNAKGQREKIEYANGVVTRYEYDPQTFRLTSLHSYKKGGSFQKYLYTYDPVGNVMSLEDQASQTVYFRNAVVKPNRTYRYDPLYRLIEANGREHAGQVPRFDHEDIPYITNIPHPNDANALRRYKEVYVYDESGNITEVKHYANGGSWIRRYQYRTQNNQLKKTIGGRSSQPTFTYHHDAHGNHINFSHIQSIDWDFKDQMISVEKGGEKVYYLYDSNGQRVRKVVENHNGIPQKEGLYLDGYEIYREFSNSTVKMQRETLQVMDDKQRIALVETLVRDNSSDIHNPVPRFRFQSSDQLESSVFELNEEGKVISFEEYYPYGGTSYHSTSSSSQVSQKRYRYSGKERDKETGFYYYGARYYATWMGRWLSCDPEALEVLEKTKAVNLILSTEKDLEPDTILSTERDVEPAEYTLNLYSSFLGNPVRYIETEGRASKKWALLFRVVTLQYQIARNILEGEPIAVAIREGVAGASKPPITKVVDVRKRMHHPTGGPGPDPPRPDPKHARKARRAAQKALPKKKAPTIKKDPSLKGKIRTRGFFRGGAQKGFKGQRGFARLPSVSTIANLARGIGYGVVYGKIFEGVYEMLAAGLGWDLELAEKYSEVFRFSPEEQRELQLMRLEKEEARRLGITVDELHLLWENAAKIKSQRPEVDSLEAWPK